MRAVWSFLVYRELLRGSMSLFSVADLSGQNYIISPGFSSAIDGNPCLRKIRVALNLPNRTGLDLTELELSGDATCRTQKPDVGSVTSTTLSRPSPAHLTLKDNNSDDRPAPKDSSAASVVVYRAVSVLVTTAIAAPWSRGLRAISPLLLEATPWSAILSRIL